MGLYLNISTLEINYDIYNIGTPAIFDYISKPGFSTRGACAKNATTWYNGDLKDRFELIELEVDNIEVFIF